jgi:hypothetical protein
VQGKGRAKSVIAVPMELLTIERGQKRRGLLIGDQQANLVKKAAQPPDTKRKVRHRFFCLLFDRRI